MNPSLPFLTLLKKEVFRFWGVATQSIIAPIVSAGLYLLVFGVSLGSRVSVYEGIHYAQFVIPGLVLMGVIMNSFSNTSFSLFMSRYLGSIVDLLVTPISPTQFIMALTLAAMLRGMVIGLAIYGISIFFADIPWVFPLHALGILTLASFLFSQFGIVAGLYSNTFDSLSVYTSFVLTPLIYLGGLFYPISMLPEPWNKVSMFNPLFYLIDGFRHAALGISDTSFAYTYGVGGAASFGLFIWAAYLIGKGHKLKN